LFETPDLLSIIPCSPSIDAILTPPNHLGWYSWWVGQQVRRESKEIFSALPNYNQEQESVWVGSFVSLWQEISRYTIENNPVSIDEIVLHLVENKFLHLVNEASPMVAKNLVFAVLGWQTMLYRADTRSCCPSQLAIADDMDGHKGQAYMCLRQSMSTCQAKLHQFLLGFGVLLPPLNFNSLLTEESGETFEQFKSVTTTSLNAYSLTCIAKVKIKWVDSLACHLEFDAHSNTLFLFRYPSFCVVNLPQSGAKLFQKSVIHACAAPVAGAGQWATAAEVTQMLRETILSYRLLFGQNKAARRLFRKLRPFEGISEHGRDHYLDSICSRKQWRAVGDERETYDLCLDFPIMRGRLAILAWHLSKKKPQTWRELWRDRRDSASWLTFWTVLIIGGLGVTLALLQTVLQVVQIVQQNQH
jgi:hypothetical protein